MRQPVVGLALFAVLAGAMGCGDDDDGRAPVPTATVPGSTATVAATATQTAAATATVTRTSTATATPTQTPTPTDTPLPPAITYFGVASADDVAQTPVAVDTEGRPIYVRLQGQGMSLIIEGTGGRPLGTSAYDAGGGTPDLQLLVSKPLGDGSLAVCDKAPPTIGGIPATSPLQFSNAPAVVNAINDFGCRVNDGTGVPEGRTVPSQACTMSDAPFGFGFVDETSLVQFCLPIARDWAFPTGDTIVAARVRDVDGRLSAEREIVIRVTPSTDPRDCTGMAERLVTIDDSISALLTSASNGTDVSIQPWSGGPLRLCIGDAASDGRRPVILAESATLGIRLRDASVLCVKLFSQGSSGSIDCNGGTAYDVLASQDSRGDEPADAVVTTSGLGTDAGAGAAAINVRASFLNLPSGVASDCDDRPFGSGFDVVLTTANGRAEVLNPIQGGTVTFSATGQNFDCSRLTDSTGPGTFVLPFAGVDTVVGDVANVLILAE